MNKRAMKKAEKNKRRKFVELFDLALQANGLECRTEKTGNLPTVFCDFSGHVSTIFIRVYMNGWVLGGNHQEAEVCLDYRYNERDYQKVKKLLMQAIEKAEK